MTHDELVEKVAMSDAEFDRRDWLGMSRSDRERYKKRAHAAIAAIYEAVREPCEAEPSPFIEDSFASVYRQLIDASALKPEDAKP